MITEKTEKKTRAKKRFKDTKTVYYGEEPKMDRWFPTEEIFKKELSKSLSWYNNVASNEDLKSYTLEYIKALDISKQDLKIIQSANELEFKVIGALCRMYNLGMTPPNEEDTKLRQKIISRLNAIKRNGKPAVAKSSTISKYDKIQAAMNQKRQSYMGAIEDVVDNFLLTWKSDFSMKKWLFERQVPSAYVSPIKERYSSWVTEISSAISGDEYWKEAYSNYSKPRLGLLREFLNNIIKDCEEYTQGTKKSRKPRKAKEKSPDKVTSKVKFQLGIPELKITSVKPEKIVKAEQVWLFDTAYRNLTVLYALEGGLTVRGTSIHNYDEKLSCKKKIRKPNEILPKIVNGGKVFLRKVMDSIKCRTQPAKGRLGKSTVILRVL